MDNISTPPLPFSAEAEKALLGAVMIEPGIAAGIDLVSDAFYVHRNRWVWEAIKRLESRGISPDFVTVGDELAREASCFCKSESVDDVIEAGFKRGHQRAHGIRTALQNRRLHVISELPLRKPVGETRLLLFQEFFSEFRASHASAALRGFGLARFREHEFLRLAFFKDAGAEPLADFIFWSDEHVRDS